jgi:DNA repair protein RadC
MELAETERPQERLQRLGASALSETELLAMLLRSGSKGHNVLNIASEIINDAGSLSNLVSWDDSEFRRFKGIGKVKALQLVTVVEICRRVLAANNEANPVLDSPERIFEFMRSRTIGLEVEKFWSLCLDRKNRLIRSCEVTSGTASHSLVHPREVFREAIRHGASAIICVHNHPSGDPSPSAADIKVTLIVRDSCI